MWNPGEYQEGRNLGEYQRKTRVSTRKGRNSGEYKKNRNLGEYQRRTRVSTGRRIKEGVESRRVPKNHKIKKG